MSKRMRMLLIAGIGVIGAIVIIALVFSSMSPQFGADEEPGVAYISITDQGFVPAEIQIERGTSVIWRNETTMPHQVASNPYPERSELPSLNSQGHIQPQAEYTYAFAENGTFGYHDYLNPSMSGRVTVVE